MQVRNRSWTQKLKLAAWIVLPMLILGALILIASTGMLHLHRARPVVDARVPAVTPMAEPKAATAQLEVVNIRLDKTTNVRNLDPHRRVKFQAPLKLASAQFVLVRDVHPN